MHLHYPFNPSFHQFLNFEPDHYVAESSISQETTEKKRMKRTSVSNSSPTLCRTKGLDMQIVSAPTAFTKALNSRGNLCFFVPLSF